MPETPEPPETLEPQERPGEAQPVGDVRGRHPATAHPGFRGPVRTLVVRLGLTALVGVLAGLAAAAFLAGMRWATEAFVEHRLLLFLLPVGGFAVGLIYHYVGKGSGAGNNLILDEIHEPQAWIPRRMALLVLIGTVVTHLLWVGRRELRGNDLLQWQVDAGDLLIRADVDAGQCLLYQQLLHGVLADDAAGDTHALDHHPHVVVRLQEVELDLRPFERIGRLQPHRATRLR